METCQILLYVLQLTCSSNGNLSNLMLQLIVTFICKDEMTILGWGALFGYDERYGSIFELDEADIESELDSESSTAFRNLSRGVQRHRSTKSPNNRMVCLPSTFFPFQKWWDLLTWILGSVQLYVSYIVIWIWCVRSSTWNTKLDEIIKSTKELMKSF